MNEDDTSHFFFEKDFLRPRPWYPTESNMADKDVFKEFLHLSINDYPAEHYALFTLSAWGSGWQGVFSDTHGTGSGSTLSLITMPEIASVLNEVTNNGEFKIDVYGIDVCVPGMIEVAYEIAPYVDYMVANEEHGFGGPDEISDDGLPLEWNYSFFLRSLHDDPEMAPEDFVKLISNSYNPGKFTPMIYNKFKAPSFYPVVVYKTDLSATKLSEIDNLIFEFNNLIDILRGNFSKFKDDVKSARDKTREYGKLYRKFWFLPGSIMFGLHFDPLGYDAFIDFFDFIDRLKDESADSALINACEKVKLAFSKAVIANNKCEDDFSFGLSIYFPQYKCQYNQSIWRGLKNPKFVKIPCTYEEQRFSIDTGWDEFIREYLAI
jgi:hypothetical protein